MKNMYAAIFEPIADDFELLNLMIEDVNNSEAIYQPGAYWSSKTKAALREIKKFGLADFRGCSNGIATSYGDNAYIDIRGSYNFGIRSLLTKLNRGVFPFNRFFDNQVCLTKTYFDEAVKYRTEYLKNLDRVQGLLSKYRIPSDSCRGGCLSSGMFNDEKISHHYLQILDTLDSLSDYVDLSTKTSFFEIGGGFGINTHILIENYPNIRKIIYLDVPPNLYVGTQYLKSFYGSRVKTYRETRTLDRLHFEPNNELEIICITPAQIERLDCEIDFFHNAHSFVEMPNAVVANYAKHVERLLSKETGSISLVSYDNFDLNTINPDDLPKFFLKPFKKCVIKTLTPWSSNFHYVA